MSMHHIEEVDEYLLPSGKTLPPGDYVLTIHYSGNISTNDNKGFYVALPMHLRTGKVDAVNVKSAQLTTTFESTYARQVFPCFDEPSFKATFQVLIICLSGCS